ncbi:MAG: glycosyltransferase [Candidatus Accumulibacter sp.]|jgi:GT2 family glycosyltransferase/predicted SAM-dependent methyltransferase/tetratricopeptide (TPR) repeat protein|nr:glycosyltransferase [Accumulibacter sp.]
MNIKENSTPLRLHLGCGSRILPGFVNIDAIPGVDLQIDVRKGLPFPDASCDTVFSEHFIEHLDRREGLRLLREVRRVLKTGGILRLATPGLEGTVAAYQSNRLHEGFAAFGLPWVKTRCEALNVAMREWGHKFVYDEEELRRVAEIAGFTFTERCRIGESTHEALRNLEYRAESDLILEFIKSDRRLAADAVPLVSVTIPAYKPKYFEKALKSAIAQTWKNIEIVICDDCPDKGIEEIVKKFEADPRVRYLRNPNRVDNSGCENHALCFTASNGEFIKFLNDDDTLAPDCVERLLEGFRKYPDITLAFSKRALIDADDRALPDRVDSLPLSTDDCVFEGTALAAGLLISAYNFIGEPTTPLFRKSELASNKPHFMAFAGHDRILVVRDHAIWCNLLSKGNAAYVPATLSCFRIHPEQQQRDPGIPEEARINFALLRDGAYRLGLMGEEPEIFISMVLPIGNHPAYWKANIERLGRLAERKDCDWKVYDRLGDYAEKMGNKALAISWYQRAEERAGEPVRENLKLAKLLTESDRFAEAVPLLERYIERFPEAIGVREWIETALTGRATLENRGEEVQAAFLLDYWRWRERRLEDPLFETLRRERAENLWKTPPLFEILLILNPGEEALLADSIDSLARQYYTGWRLGIFAQTPSPEAEFTQSDSPVRWVCCPPEELAEHVNAYIAESPTHWFGFFECGTRFSEDAFLTLGDYIAIRPQWKLIYADDDCVARNGKFHSPRFKPDLNLEFLRSTDYIGGFFIEKYTLASAGGFSTIPGAAPYDLLLRAIDASGEAAVGHIPEILVHLCDSASMGADDEGATEALRRHFKRRKTPVSILSGLTADARIRSRSVVYLHEEKPKVSIIVPTRNRLDLIAPCVESLFKKTTYPNWELVIADNDSDDPKVHAYYDRLRARFPGRVKIVPTPGDFDYSAMNNRAARQAEGEYLLLLNNDTECIDANWLDAMMSHAQRPDVGIVGARLLFPETLKIQHAGVVLGLAPLNTANHIFVLHPHDAPSYMNRTFVDQEYSAVTGACLLVRASIFHQVAGLDPLLKLQHQDVDLCLKVGELGYRVVWTPFATLLHQGSASFKHLSSQDMEQATFAEMAQETENFIKRWKHRLSSDPAWNRHLSLWEMALTLENELVVPWNTDFHDRPRVLFLPVSPPATAEYRGVAPLRALNLQGRLHYADICQLHEGQARRAPTPVELDRLAPDVLVMHTPVNEVSYAALLSYKESNPGVFRIYSLDDLLTCLPEDHPMHSMASGDEFTKRVHLGLGACDRLLVSTEPLAEAFRTMIDDIRVVPNALEWRVWGHLQSKRRQGRKPRIGWTGAQQHAGDLRFLTEVVKATCKDADWIFFGMIPEEIRPYVAEFHDFHHDFPTYPEKLASLNLDLAVAPLEIHPFNEAKSNLHLLEFGILGWPVICSDIFPFRTDNPPVTRLPNDPDKWIAAILERIADPDALAREGDALREWVKKHYLLENRLDAWMDALSTT